MKGLWKKANWVNAAMASIASVVSLYWSLVLGWIPCDFCWYERICMYPLAVIYVVSLFQREYMRSVTLILSASGMVLSLYHYLLQVVPALSTSTHCESAVSCAVPDFEWLGFITPPFLSLLVFVCIFVLDMAAPHFLSRHTPSKPS